MKYYLSAEREEVPAWIANHRPGDRPAWSTILGVRNLFYPGAYLDEMPLLLMSRTRCYHFMIYIDNLYEWDEVMNRRGGIHLDGLNRVRGYRVLDAYHPDLCSLLAVLERREDFPENFGPSRFAMLFIRTDALTVIPLLRSRFPGWRPFIALTSYDMMVQTVDFGRGTEFERQLLEAPPRYQLCNFHFEPWTGFVRTTYLTGTPTHTMTGGLNGAARVLYRYEGQGDVRHLE